MKTILTCISILILINITSAQQPYYPLVQENKTWYVVHSFFGSPSGTGVYKCEGDTIVGDTTYKVVYMTYDEFPIHWTKAGFLYEDENQRVVFSRYKAYDSTYFKPQLLYDFGAEIGDSLTISPLNEFTDQVDIIISAIDSVLVDGDYRQRTWFDCEISNWNFWIEGIGSNTGLLEPGFYCTIICPGQDLHCVKKDGITIYPDSYTGACYVVGIDDVVEKENVFSVYPNPANDYIEIRTEQQFTEELYIRINGLMGQLMSQQALHYNFPHRISVGNLSPGLYIYTIASAQQSFQKGLIRIH